MGKNNLESNPLDLFFLFNIDPFIHGNDRHQAGCFKFSFLQTGMLDGMLNYQSEHSFYITR